MRHFNLFYLTLIIISSCSYSNIPDDLYVAKSDSLRKEILIAKDSLNKYKLVNPYKYNHCSVLLNAEIDKTDEIDRVVRTIIDDGYISKDNIKYGRFKTKLFGTS